MDTHVTQICINKILPLKIDASYNVGVSDKQTPWFINIKFDDWQNDN